jgi:hypothetical protein
VTCRQCNFVQDPSPQVLRLRRLRERVCRALWTGMDSWTCRAAPEQLADTIMWEASTLQLRTGYPADERAGHSCKLLFLASTRDLPYDDCICLHVEGIQHMQAASVTSGIRHMHPAQPVHEFYAVPSVGTAAETGLRASACGYRVIRARHPVNVAVVIDKAWLGRGCPT